MQVSTALECTKRPSADASEVHEFTENHANRAGLKVAFRQSMVDYATVGGLESLQKHSSGSSDATWSTTVDTHALFGPVDIEISEIRWTIYFEPQCTAVKIHDRMFWASSCDVYAYLDYHWWRRSQRFCIRDSGSVSLPST